MKNRILANLHWLIILYACNNLYFLYEEKNTNLNDSNASLSGLQAQKNRLERKLVSITKFKKNLNKSKDRVKEVVSQIEKVQRQLPSEVRDTDVAQRITSLGDQLKMRNLAVNPLPEKQNGFYFTKSYTVTAEATFLQSIIFLENLKKSERILNVRDIVIRENVKKSRGRFKVLLISANIESYRYNTKYREKSGVEEIEKKYEIR